MSTLSERIAALSPAQRALLERRLKAERPGNTQKRITPRTRERDSFPLSFAQQRFWFLDQFEPGNTSYNNPTAYRFKGALDVSAVERALNEIIRRHEILRTVFVTENGQPVQVVRPSMPLKLGLVQITGATEAEREAEAHRLANEEARRPFDLSRGPLLRAVLYRLGERDHIGVFNMHHIVCDAWSLQNMMREMAALYDAFTRGRPSPLEELPLQYADYAAWQRDWLQGAALERELSFWRQQLEDVPTVLELPTDRPRPPVQSLRGNHLAFVLSRSLTERLKALSRREGETLFVVLLAAFYALLYRYTGQTDIVVGTPITNRSRVEVEPLIGLFLNTLALRARVTGDEAFLELVRGVGRVMLEARSHQELPFERVVEAVGVERTLSHTPLVQVMFTLVQRAASEASAVRVGDIEMGQVWTEGQTSAFDLTLALNDAGEVISGSFEYNSDLFDEATVQRFSQHFTNLLEGVTREPRKRVCQLPLLSESERERVLSDWQATARDFNTSGLCIHQLFEAQAATRPDAVALIHEEEQLTYAELNARANRLAQHLRALGVGPEVPVCVLVERSAGMIVALLGVLKAGGLYVPVDPNYPEERLRYVLEDSGAPLLVTQRALAQRLPALDAQILYVEDERPELGTDANVSGGAAPDNLAYVIYTSGSTGRPKGVGVSHRSLVNYINAASELFETAPTDRVLQFSSISFDASAEDIYTTLTRGATLVLRTEAMLASASDFLSRARDWELTVIDLPTAYWHELVSKATAEDWSLAERLRLVIVGGEKAVPERVAEWRETAGRRVRLLNGYGPTEATIAATFDELPAGSDAAREITIGRPVANTQAYVLDGELQPLPVGVVGELYLGGAGLARGYWQRADATADKFIPHPFSTSPGARLYRTGDRARFLPDGRLEYAGRADNQVKVRGFRIELGEIETALMLYPQVREALVLAREDAPGDKRLVAYLVPAQGAPEPTASDLRPFLKGKLPDYMIPSAYVVLAELPLTTSGKVDRRALPPPTSDRPALAGSYAEPRTKAERLLASVWAEVLGLRRVGLRDNFFELGGDSILSIQVVARAARLGLRLSPRQLFEHQTVEDLAAAAGGVSSDEDAREAGSPSDAEEDETDYGTDVPLTPIQSWFFAAEMLDPHHFNQAVMLESASLEAGTLARAADALVRRHDALRLRFERTPDGWRQRVAAPEDVNSSALGEAKFDERARNSVMRVVDLSQTPDEELKQAIEREAADAQRSFDLAAGPLLRLVLFACGPSRPDRLLVAAHHLAVDGVSWRVLLEELRAAYAQLESGGAISLPPRTSSFRRWASHLLHAAAAPEMRAEFDYWLGEVAPLLDAAPPLPLDGAGGDNTVESTEVLTTHFTAEQTRALVQQAPALYRATLEEVLLAALVRAMRGWRGQAPVAVDLEGHGREELPSGEDSSRPLDLSRTVGWFTSVYPVVFAAGEENERRPETLRRVGEALRRVPHRGVGYGLLRYLSPEVEVRRKLEETPAPPVVFNYLGRFDQTLTGGPSTADDSTPPPADSASSSQTDSSSSSSASSGPRLALADEYAGPQQSPRAERTHELEVTGGIWGDQLQISWSFSRHLHRAETITRLAEQFRREVLSLAGSPAVALQPEGARPPLFLLHPSGGQVMCYLGLARRMGRARPVYGLRALDAEGVFDGSLEEMARRQIELIREVQAEGPYHLGGWSFGAVLAYEVARQLKAAGEPVGLLGIFDISAPLADVTEKLARINGAEANELEEFDPETGDPLVLARLIGKLAGRDFEVGPDALAGLSHAAQVGRVLELAARAGAVPEGMSMTDALRALKGYQTRQRAAKRYKIGPYEGRVTIFLGRGASAEELRLRRELYGADETAGWSSLVTPRPEVVFVEGDHQTLVLEPNVETLAEKLLVGLEKAETFV